MLCLPSANQCSWQTGCQDSNNILNRKWSSDLEHKHTHTPFSSVSRTHAYTGNKLHLFNCIKQSIEQSIEVKTFKTYPGNMQAWFHTPESGSKSRSSSAINYGHTTLKHISRSSKCYLKISTIKNVKDPFF